MGEKNACPRCCGLGQPNSHGRSFAFYMHKPKFHLARHVSTRHVRRVEPMHFGCVTLVEQHGTTLDTTRLVRHDERDRRDSQLSLLCNLYKVMICKLFTNLLKYTFIWFDGTNTICICKSIKTTTLVQVSTIACLLSTMLEQVQLDTLV